MLTITCCLEQRLFVKRKKLNNTVIKQGSEISININFDAQDLLCLTFIINSSWFPLWVCERIQVQTWASSGKEYVRHIQQSFGFCNISVMQIFFHNLQKNLVSHQHKLCFLKVIANQNLESKPQIGEWNGYVISLSWPKVKALSFANQTMYAGRSFWLNLHITFIFLLQEWYPDCSILDFPKIYQNVKC